MIMPFLNHAMLPPAGVAVAVRVTSCPGTNRGLRDIAILMVGNGFTVIVADTEAPVQPLAVGATVNVVVCGIDNELVMLPVTLPVPATGIPLIIIVLLRIQLKTVLPTVLLNIIGFIISPSQTDCAVGIAVAVGIGFTITDAAIGVPIHPLTDGVMVNIAVIGAFVLFVGVPVMFPVPLLGIPVTAAVLFLTQLNTVPGTLLFNTMVATGFPEHSVCAAGFAMALGAGFMVKVKVLKVPVHTPETGVTFMVAVMGRLPVFSAVKDGISPTPLAAKPMEGVLFVQL
jgi:hypothetical protein